MSTPTAPDATSAASKISDASKNLKTFLRRPDAYHIIMAIPKNDLADIYRELSAFIAASSISFPHLYPQLEDLQTSCETMGVLLARRNACKICLATSNKIDRRRRRQNQSVALGSIRGWWNPGL